jgi:hypothetical protein
MNKPVRIRLSQSWQVPQKPDKTGRQYPPIVETLVVEVDDVQWHDIANAYTQLNTELFKARISHMKAIKQKSPVDAILKDAGF